MSSDLETHKHFSFVENGESFPGFHCCALSADGDLCLMKGALHAYLCEVKTKKVLQTFSYTESKWWRIISGADTKCEACMSPDGLYIALLECNGDVRIYNQSGETLKILKGWVNLNWYDHAGWRISLSPSPGQLFNDEQHDIYCTDIQTGRTTQWTPFGRHEGIKMYTLSPDGQQLAVTGEEKSYTVISLPTGEARFTLKSEAELTHITFTSDGHLLVAATTNTVLLINADSGKIEKQYALNREPCSISISPNGDYLAVGFLKEGKQPARIILMEIASGDIVGDEERQYMYINDIHFVPRAGKPMQLMEGTQLLDLIEN